MTEVTTHAVTVRSVSLAREPTTVGRTVRRASDLGVGTLALTGQAVGDALDRFWPGPGPRTGAPSPVRRLTKAALGVALVAERRVGEIAVAAELIGEQAVDIARRTPLVRDVLAGVDAAIDRWADHADAETARREQAVRDFVGALVPATLDAVLERADIQAVVGKIPLGEILDAVDLDALLAQVDLNAVLTHVDLDALMAQIDIDALLTRIDLDALMARIDVDGIVGRVDLDHLMARIDLGPLVGDVLTEVDIGGIVRESTGSITGDAVDTARIGAMRLDSFVGRVADRVLLRGRGNATPDPAKAEVDES